MTLISKSGDVLYSLCDHTPLLTLLQSSHCLIHLLLNVKKVMFRDKAQSQSIFMVQFVS
jgi:hypothetical protein